MPKRNEKPAPKAKPIKPIKTPSYEPLSSFEKPSGYAKCNICGTIFIDDLPLIGEILCPKGCKLVLTRNVTP